MPAGDQGMADNRVADFYPLHAFADFLHPPSVFVTHDVREIHLDLAAPNAFDDVQVSSTYAGAPDPHNDIRWFVYLGVRHVFVRDEFVSRQRLIVRVEDGGLHVSSRCKTLSMMSIRCAPLRN